MFNILASQASLFVGEGAGNTTATGYMNTGVGEGALSSITSGFINTAIGEGALSANTTGSAQTSIGQNALHASNGTSNTAVGQRAMQTATTAGYCTAVGEGSMNALTTGSNNVGVGVDALYTLTTGTLNTSVGYLSGYGVAGGNYASITDTQCTFIGAYASRGAGAPSGSGLTNATAIGYLANVDTDNTVVLGNNSVTDVKTTGTVTSFSRYGFTSQPLNPSGYAVDKYINAGGVLYIGIDSSDSVATGFNSGAGNYGTIIWRPESTGLSISRGQMPDIKISPTGVITIPSLSGIGTRQVVVDANGVLSAP